MGLMKVPLDQELDDPLPMPYHVHEMSELVYPQVRSFLQHGLATICFFRKAREANYRNREYRQSNSRASVLSGNRTIKLLNL